MDQLFEILRHARPTELNPVAVVVIAALLAALVEQRLLRRRTPDFSTAYRDVTGPPPKATAPPRHR